LKEQNKLMLEALKKGYDYSKYVACSKDKNTDEFLEKLFIDTNEIQITFSSIIKQVSGEQI
jgi:hypothetical protein